MSGRRVLVALGLLVALIGCGAEPEAPRALRRLWQGAPPERRALAADDAVALAPEPVLQTHFDGTQEWWAGTLRDDDEVGFRPHTPEGGVLNLKAGQLAGATRALDVRPGMALRVTLVGSASAPPKTEGELFLAALVQRDRAFEPEVGFSSAEINRMLDPKLSHVEVLSAEVNAGTVRLTTSFVVAERMQQLQIMLLTPLFAGHSVQIDELLVERVPLALHLAEGGDLPDLERLEEGVALTLERERRQGLLAQAGEELIWTLPALALERRFDFAWGLPRWAPPGSAVDVRVLAGDELLLEERLHAPQSVEESAWLDRQLRLPSSPEAPLVLRVQVAPGGVDAPPVALAHPVVSAALEPPRPNVLLISLDTLSADRLGSYGGDPRISARLDALAAESFRFDQASSVSSYTLPSHASMMSGQYPAFHGAVDITDRVDPARSPVLASMLADAGYLTAAFTGGGYVGTAFGFAEGFDRYSVNDPVWAYGTVRGGMLLETLTFERDPLPEEQLKRYGVESIVEWLGKRRDGPPFFAFAHTFIAHNYAPSEEWLERLELPAAPDEQRPFDHRERGRFNGDDEYALLDAVREDYLPYYDASIGMADDFVGTLLDALEAFGLDENTMVIVTSDHGEEFGEHEFFGHGETLYATNTRVPLIVRLPGARAERFGEVVEESVSLVDIAPWVLRVCGLEPDPRMAVAPPLGPLSVDPPRRRELFVELDNHVHRKSAVREDALELQVDLGAGGQEFEQEVRRLYDLASDPGQTRDLAAERPDDVKRLRRRLEQFHGLAESLHPRDGAALNLCEMDPDLIRQLQALGYLGDDGGLAALENCEK